MLGSVSGREGDGWEDVGEWKGDANKLSCHTGTITCFLTSFAMYESLNKFINSSSYVHVISRGTPVQPWTLQRNFLAAV